MKFTHIIRVPFMKLRLFFREISFSIKTLFRPLHNTQYTSQTKLFTEEPQPYTAFCDSSHCRLQNSDLESILQGARQIEFREC
jgi:hypothetical protein